MTHLSYGAPASRRRGATPLLLAASVALGACSGLTEVNTPNVVLPTSLDNAVGAAARYAGAVKLFTGNMAGSWTYYTGVMTDEMISGGLSTFSTDVILDSRRIPDPMISGTSTLNYPSMHQVRVNTLIAIDGLQRYAPAPAYRLSHLYSLLGFVSLGFAENYCSGVPLSYNSNGEVQYGASITGVEMFQLAAAQFDSARQYAGDSARFTQLAQVGKARALVGLGRQAEAAALVATVPTAYRFDLEISSAVSGQTNGIFSISNGRSDGVADREGGVGLDFRSARDPRVTTTLIGKGPDGATDIYLFGKYNSLSAPFTLGSGIEARLIEAEAALLANKNDASTTGTGWLGILNAVRATAITPALPALADPGSYDGRVDLLFRERAFWLFLTDHRLGDLRRLVRQYGRGQATVFPSGVYKDGVPYGSDVNFSIPDIELNNPNFKGCLDRSA